VTTEGGQQDPFPAQFAADLASADPGRVAAALSRARGLLPGSRSPLPRIDPAVLDTLPNDPPWEVVQDFVWLIAHYPNFVPPLTQQDKLRLWLDAILRTADSAAALQVAQYLRPVREPGADIDAALRSIAESASSPRFGDRQARGAEHLARNLLEQHDTNKRTVAALRAWVGVPALQPVIHHLAPFVRPEDRPGLGLMAP